MAFFNVHLSVSVWCVPRIWHTSIHAYTHVLGGEGILLSCSITVHFIPFRQGFIYLGGTLASRKP